MIEEQNSQLRVVLELKDYSCPPTCSHCGRSYRLQGYSHPGLDIPRDALSRSPSELLIPDIKEGWERIARSITHRHIHHRTSLKCDQQSLRFGPEDSFYIWSRYGFVLFRAAGLTYNEIQQAFDQASDHASSASALRRAVEGSPDRGEMERLNADNRNNLAVTVEVSKSFPAVWKAQVSGEISKPTFAYAHLLKAKSLEDPRSATLKLNPNFI